MRRAGFVDPDLSGDRAVGAVGRRRARNELGYRLPKSAWGQGYATEGSRALIHKGFADLGVQRVVASTMVVNVASRRVMEKAGLRFVRTFHQPWPDYLEGEEQGDVEYALLRSEWEQPTAEAVLGTHTASKYASGES